jgi:mannose-1-phosphate guanylyltransferase
MQLILLSGGSGQRLWPLSNEARSKQFLRVLDTPNGGREPMVQRVVRQIKVADMAENITFATSISQKDIITNQLGEDISILTEPCRRDTFPAIALAASYLAKEKKCNRDEDGLTSLCQSLPSLIRSINCNVSSNVSARSTRIHQ